MHIVYYDESGDDGYPKYSSPLFCLTAIYLHHLTWKDTYEEIRTFRKYLRDTYKIPVKLEFHTKYFILNKNPYRKLRLTDSERLGIIDGYCNLIADLELKIVNVIVVKPRLQKQTFDVLDTALKFSVQRVENDLSRGTTPHRFMIITDPGRVGKMRKTTRRIQRINYIPSKFYPGTYRKEIKGLIEDPLQKDSKESYFIQLADLVAYIVYLYGLENTKAGAYSNRLKKILPTGKVKAWMDILAKSLNLEASRDDPYGVVLYPS